MVIKANCNGLEDLIGYRLCFVRGRSPPLFFVGESRWRGPGNVREIDGVSETRIRRSFRSRRQGPRCRRFTAAEADKRGVVREDREAAGPV